MQYTMIICEELKMRRLLFLLLLVLSLMACLGCIRPSPVERAMQYEEQQSGEQLRKQQMMDERIAFQTEDELRERQREREEREEKERWDQLAISTIF